MPVRGFLNMVNILLLKEALPDYLKDFVTFAYKTGWRLSEISKLTWKPDRCQARYR